MKKTIKAKILIDILMSLTMLFLMAYGLIGENIHEWLGIGMFILFVVHHILNHKWLINITKGKYTPIRTIQTVTAILILLCMIGSMTSGIIISRYVFDFLNLNESMSVMKIHTFCAFWGFVLMSFHLGLHWNMFVSIIKKQLKPSKIIVSTFCIISILIAGYGIYAFIHRDIGIYLLLRSHFVFYDFSEPVIFFLLDYLAIMEMFVFAGYHILNLIKSVFRYKNQTLK